MKGLTSKEASIAMDRLGKERTPFLAVVDFEMDNICVHPLNEMPDHIFYDINGCTNAGVQTDFPIDRKLDKYPIHFERYKTGFELVKSEIHYGNSFLLNLSYPTEIKTTLSFRQIFDYSQAKYKLLMDDFVVFSPEPFIEIRDGIIASFPMKGTIDANLDNAEELLKSNQKELAEHFTIVDLIRNDLSKVAKNVCVDKFRYLERIRSAQKDLLQMSSKITGTLPDDYLNHLGEILFSMLPAGSITGAPKKKTVEIIQEAELLKRGYYTGIVVYFDGASLDSGVMIRCIEKRDGKKYFRSGGGITHMSKLEEEYQELLDKVYVPIIRNDKNHQRQSATSGLSQPTMQ